MRARWSQIRLSPDLGDVVIDMPVGVREDTEGRSGAEEVFRWDEPVDAEGVHEPDRRCEDERRRGRSGLRLMAESLMLAMEGEE